MLWNNAGRRRTIVCRLWDKIDHQVWDQSNQTPLFHFGLIFSMNYDVSMLPFVLTFNSLKSSNLCWKYCSIGIRLTSKEYQILMVVQALLFKTKLDFIHKFPSNCNIDHEIYNRVSSDLVTSALPCINVHCLELYRPAYCAKFNCMAGYINFAIANLLRSCVVKITSRNCINKNQMN